MAGGTFKAFTQPLVIGSGFQKEHSVSSEREPRLQQGGQSGGHLDGYTGDE